MTRMTEQDRRAQLLAAARAAFAVHGYAGTSLVAVARRADVTPPYVSRVFGTKRQLFLAVLYDTTDNLDVMVRAGAAVSPGSAGRHAARRVLLRCRDHVAVLLHACTTGADPAVAAAARECLGRLYSTVREMVADDTSTAARLVAAAMLAAALQERKPLAQSHRESGSP